MRILHLLRSLNPAHGGPIEAVRLLSLVHQAEGHHVEVASLDAPGDPIGDIPGTPHQLGPARSNYGYSSAFAPWLRENRERFDGVIVNGLWQYHGLACRQVLHGTTTPYFVFPHGMLDPWFKQQYPLKHLKKWLYWPWAEYRVLRDATAVFFTCEEEKLLAARSFWLYDANSIVTGLGTQPPPAGTQNAAASLTTEYPELRGKRVILFMGRIHPKKGLDLLLQAFAHTLAAKPEWHLLVAGPDQVGLQSELQTLAQSLGISARVTWAGPQMGARKWAAIAAAEVFALPSHQENFGIAVTEGLACGKPVLISNQVNIWREIQQDGAGLVAPDTIAGTAQLLAQWSALDAAQRETFAQSALACFNRRFDIRGCAAAIIDAMQRGGA